jgi:hypothetical protein
VVEREEEEGHVYKVQRLVYYFEGYKITVIIDFPLGDILCNRDVTRHISKWVVELEALNIDFSPRKGISSQALADFVAKWIEIQQPTPDAFLDHWKMYFDRSLKLGGAIASVLFHIPKREKNLNMYSKYCGKPQITKQSMKHSSIDCGL